MERILPYDNGIDKESSAWNGLLVKKRVSTSVPTIYSVGGIVVC